MVIPGHTMQKQFNFIHSYVYMCRKLPIRSPVGPQIHTCSNRLLIRLKILLVLTRCFIYVRFLPCISLSTFCFNILFPLRSQVLTFYNFEIKGTGRPESNFDSEYLEPILESHDIFSSVLKDTSRDTQRILSFFVLTFHCMGVSKILFLGFLYSLFYNKYCLYIKFNDCRCINRAIKRYGRTVKH